MSGIDIEKEREWWGCESEALKQVAFSDAEDRAIRYLDEIERLRENHVGSGKIIEELLAERDTLRAQLADQRARDIRMMAFEVFGNSLVSGTPCYDWKICLRIAADAYDEIAAIEVPAKKGGEL